MISFKEHAKINDSIVEALNWHLSTKTPLVESLFRVGSANYFALFREARKLSSTSSLSEVDAALLEETEIGEFAEYDGKPVPLDCPMYEEELSEEDEGQELNKPRRGGSKKFIVYVRDPVTKNIKKVEWGDTSGLSVKINDPKARASFAARHQCSTRNDKTAPSYWACRTPRYAKQLGLSGGGNFFW